MNDFIKADVFFMVTTVAVVLVSAGILIALIYFVKILRDVKSLSGKVRKEGEEIVEDVGKLRSEIRAEGKNLKRSLGSLFNWGRKGRKISNPK